MRIVERRGGYGAAIITPSGPATHLQGMGNQPRVSKGVPNAGEWTTVERADSGVSLGPWSDTEPTVMSEDEWQARFSPEERSRMTRLGITYPEWAEVAEVTNNAALVVQLYQNGYTDPGEVAAITNALQSDYPVVKRDEYHDFSADDFEAMRQWPRNRKVGSLKTLNIAFSAGDIDTIHEYASAICQKERYTPDTAYGGAVEFYKAGINLEQAQQWAGVFPGRDDVAARAAKLGWSLDDSCGRDAGRTYEMARLGLNPEEADSLGKARAGVNVALKYRAHGFTPDETDAWVNALNSSRYRYGNDAKIRNGYADVALTLRGEGVTPEQVEAAARSGVDFTHHRGPYPGDIAAVAKLPAEELESWAEQIGGNGRTARAAAIAQWRDVVGVSDPVRAGQWARAFHQHRGDPGFGSTETVRFANQYVDPTEWTSTSPHPIVLATARALDMPVERLAEQAGKAKGGVVEGCRTAFRRRRQDPPF